ncbi:MAG: thrombospondin type 3 repeat-containing protein [Patescibacteria group bacterium]
MFNDNNNPVSPGIKDNQATVVKPPIQTNVYVMPDKFHPQKAQVSSNKAFGVVILVLVLVVVSSAAYFGYNFFVKNVSNAPLPIVENQNPIEDVDIATTTQSNNELVPTSTAPTSTLPTSTLMETTTTPPTSTVATTTVETTTPSNPNSPPIVSSDGDSDGLTDLEEVVIGTDSNKPDTDEDGFSDSEEIMNGYSPTKAGGGEANKLKNDKSIATLTTNFVGDNFQTLYPRAWQVSFLEANKQALITIDTGEIIKISVRDDTQELSAMNWYLIDHPQVTVSQLKQVDYGNLSGIFASDGLVAYLSNKNKTKIYSFEYLMNPKSEFRYSMLFALMVKNFKPLDVSSTTTSTGNLIKTSSTRSTSLRTR